MEMAHHRVGYLRQQTKVNSQQVVSLSHMHMTIRRGPNTLTIDQRMRFVETPAGKPLLAVLKTDSGGGVITTTMHFHQNGIVLTVEQAGRKHTQHFPPIKGKWFPPGQEQAYLTRQVIAGTKKFSYRTLDPSAGVKPVRYTWTRIGRQNVRAFGKTVSAVAYTGQSTEMPGHTLHVWVDRKGLQVRATTNLIPGMPVTQVWADKQMALSKVNPLKIMAKLLIHPDKPIAHPRTLRQAIYHLHITGKNPVSQARIPTAGYQRVVWADARDVTVVVDLNHPDNPVGDLPTKADRQPSTMINSADPKIQALLKQALGKHAKAMSDRAKAFRLRQFVANYIDQTNLAVGMASASEVARTREGDCTEHAVLLAALLRAAGIPSRIATGLLYVRQFLGKQDVFGYHMWTQAWLPGPPNHPAAKGRRWVDLDPILPADGPPFDATHITLDLSSMADGQVNNGLISMMTFFGRLKINVVHTGQSAVAASGGSSPESRPAAR